MQPKTNAPLCDLAPVEEKLIRLYCSAQPSTDDIARWFASVDFEALFSETSYLAATVSAAQNYAGVPELLVPRLKGILKYVHTLNGGTISALLHLGKQFNQAEIPMLLLKSTALYIGCPEVPRYHLWKAEIGIPEYALPLALEIAVQAGFSVEPTSRYVIASRDKMQHVFLYPYQEDNFLLEKAKPVSVQDICFLMPSLEPLMVSLAESLIEILMLPNPRAKPFSLLLMLYHLAQTAPQWEETAAIAAQRGSANQVRLALESVTHLIPDSVKQDVLTLFGTRKQAEGLKDALLAYRSLKPKANRIGRLWLSVRIQTADRPAAFPGKLAKKLLLILARKLHIKMKF